MPDYEMNHFMAHPVYSDISYINGQINRMNLSQMKRSCLEANLDPHGKREAVKRRLKEYYKEKKLVEAGLIEAKRNRNVDYFVVIDFEATCHSKNNPADYEHEIIEFPAVLVATSEPPRIVDIFHSYCRPVINPILSDFCRQLTGISQDTVDNADTFGVVHQRFVQWIMEKHKLGIQHTFSIVTDGPFDMGRFLYQQFLHINEEFPSYAYYWVNIRKAFANFYKKDYYSTNGAIRPLPGLQKMLSAVGLEFQGQPHSGLDDAKNLSRIIIRLISDKAYLRVNERVIECLNRFPLENDNIRIRNVVGVNKKEAEAWIIRQKNLLL